MNSYFILFFVQLKEYILFHCASEFVVIFMVLEACRLEFSVGGPLDQYG